MQVFFSFIEGFFPLSLFYDHKGASLYLFLSTLF